MKSIAHFPEYIISLVKHGGGSIMLLGFLYNWLVHGKVDGTILEENKLDAAEDLRWGD